MSTSLSPVDISNIPVLAGLVKEVEATKKPRELIRDNHVLAVLNPASEHEKKTAKAAYQKSLEAIGSWSDLNADELITNIYRWRKEGSRPIVFAHESGSRVPTF